MNPFIKEACVENLSQAKSAEKNGANRIELCSHLEVGGLTPSEELISMVLNHVNIPVRVMIRPRAGNFLYSEKEIFQMEASIEFCKRAGVEGVVFGILKQDHCLNIQAIRELISAAFPLKVVIHKAIDNTPDPLQSVRELAELGGVDTILTSGGFATAFEGKENLREMLKICGNEVELMPAGKITKDNLLDFHQHLEARAYHGRSIVGTLR